MHFCAYLLIMKILKKFQKNKILVIGDVMLDEYQYGTVKRISPEAPVPVFLMDGTEYKLGGAANVALNMAVNDQHVSIMSVTGDDSGGQVLRRLLREHGIDDSFLLTDIERPTSRKSRLLAENNQQVLRIDHENTISIKQEISEKLLQLLRKYIDNFDIIVLSDYMKGLLNVEFTKKVIEIAAEKNIKILSDVKDCRFEKYKNSFIVKPNIKELNMLTLMPVETEDEIKKASEFLRIKCNSDYVLTTCGSRGMVLVGRNGEYHKVNTTAQDVYDVTGAGDTVIAFLAMSLASGADIIQSMILANDAAGVQVSKVGTSSVRLEEIYSFQKNNITNGNPVNKRMEKNELRQFRTYFKEKKIVFTNGCFDILHIGHLRFLKEAASLGDIFIVGLNSDQSIRRIKGEGRPINCEKDRLEMLEFLDFIDGIVVFDEDTPVEVIEECQPDILVKGGDYKLKDIVGRSVVEARGGKVCTIPYIEGKSTTEIISKIKFYKL